MLGTTEHDSPAGWVEEWNLGCFLPALTLPFSERKKAYETVKALIQLRDCVILITSSKAPKVRALFKFKWLIWSCLWSAAIESLCIWSGIDAVAQGRALQAIMLAGGYCLVIGFVGGILILGFSDIVIDNENISRSFFGIILQAKSWSSIEKLVVRHIVYQDLNRRKLIRGFTFRGRKSGGVMPNWVGLDFIEKAEHMNDLLNLLNYYIAKHGITIESVNKEVKTVINRL